MSHSLDSKNAGEFLIRVKQFLKRHTARSHYWQDERAYWEAQMRSWYMEQYGYELHPIQSDPRNVPSPRLTSTVQPRKRGKPLAFFASGQRLVMCYLRELHDHGFDPSKFDRLLDFGVGFGRLLVHYYPFRTELHGCDPSESAVAFSKSHYGNRAAIIHTGINPPLPYPNEHFDYIYANSVFTHIGRDSLASWVEEVARIAKPGACVIISMLAASHYLRDLAHREFDQIEMGAGIFESGLHHVRHYRLFAMPDVQRRWWDAHFEILEFRSHFKEQDHLVMRRLN